MANPNSRKRNSRKKATSLSDFPEDVQLRVLSFLTPSDISTFASTSKRFLSLCRSDDKLWFSLCHRRWGSKTQIHEWTRNGKKITYRQLYNTLDEYDNLIGFWRRCGKSGLGLKSVPPPLSPLVFFEWGPSFITGSRVSPCKTPGSYNVVKAPFIWLSVMENGSPISFVDPECRLKFGDDLDRLAEGELDQLVQVNVSFLSRSHVEVRREKERQGRRRNWIKWKPEYFVKIVYCSPTWSRPLQGLWKVVFLFLFWVALVDF